MRTDQRRPQITGGGAGDWAGQTDAARARTRRLEVYECSLNHSQSMQGPATYALSYGCGLRFATVRGERCWALSQASVAVVR